MRLDAAKLLESLGIDAEQKHDELVALCPAPWHDDQRAGTWRMVAEGDRTGLHNCWSCGLQGDAIGLVRVVQGVGYLAAACWVEEYALTDEDAPSNVRVLFEERLVFRMPVGFEHAPLARWPSVFWRYARSRGVTPAQVERWGIGYALEGRLEGRIVFPLRGRRGELLSYSARAIDDHADARYLNPRKSEGAKQALFGEERWGQHPHEVVVVVEGAIKALAVERVADVAVAGLIGASQAESAEVHRKLSRFDEVVVATDPDAAGDRAALALERALGVVACRRARPPEDADIEELDPLVLRGILE
jgi:DNA primase